MKGLGGYVKELGSFGKFKEGFVFLTVSIFWRLLFRVFVIVFFFYVL